MKFNSGLAGGSVKYKNERLDGPQNGLDFVRLNLLLSLRQVTVTKDAVECCVNIEEKHHTFRNVRYI